MKYVMHRENPKEKLSKQIAVSLYNWMESLENKEEPWVVHPSDHAGKMKFINGMAEIVRDKLDSYVMV